MKQVQSTISEQSAVVLPVNQPPWRDNFTSFLRAGLRTRLGLTGALILLAMSLMAVGAPWIAPRSPNEQDISQKLLPPFWQTRAKPAFVLGTDNLGRDMLSRLIHGSRVSLTVGMVAVAVSVSIGVPLGLISGYWRGRIDNVVMALAEVQLAFPFILLAVAVIVVLGPSLINTVLVLGVTHWVLYGRVVRGQVLSLREREFVVAARVVGCTDRRIVWRHILPQVLTPVLVLATLQLAQMVILEAALTFLGLGVQPPAATWGSMLADGRALLYSAWWVATLPGLAITITVLGINLLGDGLRDILDPRQRI